MGILDTSGIKERFSRERWSVSYGCSLGTGWLINLTNESDFGATLDLEGFSFPYSSTAKAELSFIEGARNFANPGETIALRFGVVLDGEHQLQGGFLELGLSYAPDLNRERFGYTIGVELPTLD